MLKNVLFCSLELVLKQRFLLQDLWIGFSISRTGMYVHFQSKKVHGYHQIPKGSRYKTKLQTSVYNYLGRGGNPVNYYRGCYFITVRDFQPKFFFQRFDSKCSGCNHPKLRPFFAHVVSVVNSASSGFFLPPKKWFSENENTF